MGPLVGWCVGEELGLGVGLLVGEDEGDALGLELGVLVGPAEEKESWETKGVSNTTSHPMYTLNHSLSHIPVGPALNK